MHTGHILQRIIHNKSAQAVTFNSNIGNIKSNRLIAKQIIGKNRWKISYQGIWSCKQIIKANPLCSKIRITEHKHIWKPPHIYFWELLSRMKFNNHNRIRGNKCRIDYLQAFRRKQIISVLLWIIMLQFIMRTISGKPNKQFGAATQLGFKFARKLIIFTDENIGARIAENSYLLSRTGIYIFLKPFMAFGKAHDIRVKIRWEKKPFGIFIRKTMS